MGLFNLFSKKTAPQQAPATPAKPYKEAAYNTIYDLLFCDDINLYRIDAQPGSVLSALLAGQQDAGQLQNIAKDSSLDARYRVLAYNAMRQQGATIDQKELLGVIVEVAMPQGLDVLAAFADGTARYINHSEKLLVWETQTSESAQLTDRLFADSINVVNKIGPWDKERRPFPAKGMVRMTFLVSDGLYFGEGPFDVLQADPMGGPVIHAALQLLSYLTAQAQQAGNSN